VTLDPRVLATFNRQTLAVRTRVQSYASAQFAAGQYRDADMARFVSQVTPKVLAGRRQVSAMTDAYLTQMLQESGIKAPRRGPIDTAALRGVPVEDVYARPYQTVWTALGKGDAFDAAISAGAARLGALIATDMQMAKTYTSRDVLSHSRGVTGYLRVPSGVNTCALCEAASTRTYYVQDLMPIHANCGCSVEPIKEASRLWTPADSQAVYDVADHGEIGPVLVRAGDHFTTAEDILAA
jgi:hypothetical protein